jgi:predicted DNA-binding transcriptional regulator YafY
MDRAERLHKTCALMQQRRAVAFTELRDRLEVSSATLKRDLQYLRDRLGAPIVWDADLRAYRWTSESLPEGVRGPFYSREELRVLLLFEQLLRKLDPAGFLDEQLAPLRQRLERLLGEGDHAAVELRNRVKVVPLGRRPVAAAVMQPIVSALVQRRRLRLRYRARGTGEETLRKVSPQRLLYYRDHWHLDAWCHLRQDMRNFSLDAIGEEVQGLEEPAHEVDAKRLDAYYESSYGIFAGRQVRWARLRFSAARARWVSSEQWHPEQIGRWDDQGCWLLDLPYADPRELVMDILRHVPEVEVLGPPGLREEVVRRLRAGLNTMQPDTG